MGPVAALHDELAWFADGPLAGVSVAVTRARAQASGLAARLRALGARVVEAPTIRIEPLAFELPDLRALRPAGADLAQRGRGAPARAPTTRARWPGRRSPSSAPGTADALRARGIVADIVPERAVGESLAQALAPPGAAAAR